MEGIMMIFYFDKTIIDCDSDNWVVDELGVTELFNQLLPTMPWNSFTDTMMREMHSKGVIIKDIEQVLKRIPIHPRIVPAKSAHAAGCDLRIISDANVFFIEIIVNHLELRDCFTEMNTNLNYVNEEGRLRILPFHDFNKSSHGCPHCPPNMCKAIVIERLLSEEGNKKFIYLGDGSGDYCPSLKLRECDHVMPRTNYLIWDIICSNPNLIKASIHESTDGEELEHVQGSLIPSIIASGNDNTVTPFLSIDCKLETMPMSSHESLPKALPVPF